MKLAPDPMGTAEGRAMLDQLPDLYFAVLKGTRIEQEANAIVHCTFELPVLGKRTKTAATAREAIRAVLLELTEELTKTPADQWPAEWHRFSLSSPEQGGLDGSMLKSERFQSKPRQVTIGVTMPLSLKASLQRVAEQQRTSFAEAARQLAAIGFEDFDERTFSEASDQLLASFSSELGKWPLAETEQVMLRLDPHFAVRLRSAAKEYRRSASEFGAMCLAHGLVMQTQLVELERKVAAVQGAAIRTLAPKVGLGKHVALLSSVLAGTVRAPRAVLQHLCEAFESSEVALSELFRLSFESRAVPAFKAENGKPQVARSPTPWADAVRSLNLPADQTSELLQLDE